MEDFRFVCNDQIFTLNKKFIHLSPFIETMSKTQLDVEKKEINGELLNVIGDESPMYDYMDLYLQHIQGVAIDELFVDGVDDKERSIEDAQLGLIDLMDIMGHGDNLNPMNYPPSMWMMKIHDNWVRDNMIPLNLHKEDPFYDLTEIPIIDRDALPEHEINRRNWVDKLPEGAYVAGGYAMWLAGYTDSYKDIDVFVTNKDLLTNILMIDTYVWDLDGNMHVPAKIDKIVDDSYKGNYMSYHGMSVNSWPITFNTVQIDKVKQVILRVYDCASQIVHGFDLDCCGIFYDPHGKKLWATKRAVWSNKYKTNIIDPLRASPSYVSRLIKYFRRGFNIHTPFLDDSTVNQLEIDALKETIKQDWAEWMDFDSKSLAEESDGPCKLIQLPDEYMHLIPTEYLDMCMVRKRDINRIKKIDPDNPWGQMVSYMGNIPSHPNQISDQDRIILCKYLNIYCHMHGTREISDYTDKQTYSKHSYGTNDEQNIWDRYIELLDGVLYMPDLHWKEQDPGSQITGTFCPEPIDDMKQWWSQSQFYKST